jgi:hypothetical protein
MEQLRLPGPRWITFAAVMLMLVGAFNIVAGLVGILNEGYLTNNLLFATRSAWGWFFLVWGFIQVLASFAILQRRSWGVSVGIATAFFNALAHLAWLKAFPAWAVIMIVLDVLVLYGLVAYGDSEYDG